MDRLCDMEKGEWAMDVVAAPAAAVYSLSHVRLFATLWTVALQASSVRGISSARITEWVAISFSRGILSLGLEPKSPALQADSFPWRHHCTKSL